MKILVEFFSCRLPFGKLFCVPHGSTLPCLPTRFLRIFTLKFAVVIKIPYLCKKSKLCEIQKSDPIAILRGRAEGLVEGRAEGRSETLVEVAKNLLSIGTPIDSIMKATGMTEEEIKCLM